MDENILVGALYRSAASGEVVRVKALAHDIVYVDSTFFGVQTNYRSDAFRALFPDRVYATVRGLPVDGEWYEISVGATGVTVHAAYEDAVDGDVAVSRFSAMASSEYVFVFSRPFCTVVVERSAWPLLPIARRLPGSEVLARFPPAPPTGNDEVAKLRAQLASARADVATEKAARGRLELEMARDRRSMLDAREALAQHLREFEELRRQLGARADEKAHSAAERVVRALEAALSDVATERAERERLERQLARAAP